MKIVMIIPPRVNGYWILREDKFNGPVRTARTPYTAPMLYALIKRELPSEQLFLIEAQRDGLTYQQVNASVDRIQPDVIIAFVSWSHIPWDRKTAELDFPTIAVVVQQTVDKIDMMKLYKLKSSYICKQEIEMPIVDALREIRKHGALRYTPGFLINRDGRLEDTGDAPLADLTRFPLPAFDAFNMPAYLELRKDASQVGDAPQRMATITTMKGCIFNCRYCGGARHNMGVRYQSCDQVVAQMELLHRRYCIDCVVLLDNEFAVDMQRAKKICRNIIEKKLQISWQINNRVELFDEELIELLAKAGCDNVRLGIETTDPELQEYVDKKIDLEKAKAIISRIKKSGIKVHLYFTPGIPGETRKSLRSNARFIRDTEPYSFSTTPLFLMPNSLLYRTLKEKNEILSDDWTQYKNPATPTFVNSSYKNMKQVHCAALYMQRKAYKYLFFAHVKTGRLHFGYLLLYIMNIWVINVVIQMIPLHVRKRIRRLLLHG